LRGPKRFRVFTILLALAVGVALAQQPITQTYRQTGNLLGANAYILGANYQANVIISPVQSKNGPDVYLVVWSSTIFAGPIPPPPPPPPQPPPPPPDMRTVSVGGTVPASAIRQSPSGILSLDLDISKMESLMGVFGVECVNAICTPFTPTSFSLKGTFAPLTSEIGTFSFSRNGNQTSTNIDQYCRTTSSFSGNESGAAANFAGNIGSLVITPSGAGANGNLNLRKGQLQTTSVCVPPPPPM